MARKRKSLELKIESIGTGGVSVARENGVVYFVKGGVPGDIVVADELRRKKSYREAIVNKILVSSEDRVEPPCRFFSDCGGCTWQHLDYNKQLYWKKQNVIDSFERLGGFNDPNVSDTLPSPKQYHYRNKMEFTFNSSRWLTQREIESGENFEDRNFALGLHAPGRFDKAIDIDNCLLQSEEANSLLNPIRDKAIELGVSAYNPRKHEGFLRNLIIRSNKNGNLMVGLLTNSDRNENERKYISWFRENFSKEFLFIKTQFHAINETKSPVAIGEIQFINGYEYLEEDILGVKFRISPFSFFQTNSFQLDKFIGNIVDYAGLKNDDTVWDLYCGAGSITLPAAKKCSRIYGIELNEGAILDAKTNAHANGIQNADFFAHDLHSKESAILLESIPTPDVIIIDPPRAGMHKNLVDLILQSDAKRIVYVSCNPATQARDCAIMKEQYDIKEILPVDMFPHTFHIESIAMLERK